MNRLTAALVILLLFASLAPALAKPKVGDILPDLEIKTAPLPAEAEYLGLAPGVKSFRLSQIKAEALLVEIFSMYCPRCQARSVNALFESLTALPQGQKLKMLGLGAGNSAYEVSVFRKQYDIPLPLLPDGDYVLHKAFGTVLTPAYMVLKPAPGGKGFQVLLFQEGIIADYQAFLHEAGHAAHYASVDPGLPYTFRKLSERITGLGPLDTASPALRAFLLREAVRRRCGPARWPRTSPCPPPRARSSACRTTAARRTWCCPSCLRPSPRSARTSGPATKWPASCSRNATP